MSEPHSTHSAMNGGEDLGATIMIVVGGIGGLTAALALQHFRVTAHVFEQAIELREIGTASSVSNNTGITSRRDSRTGKAMPVRHW